MNTKESRAADLHCHILPGMDDGAENIDMSKAILKKEIQDGVTNFAFTPHYYVEQNSIEEFLSRREQAAAELAPACKEMSIRWKLGAEVHLALDLIDVDLKPLCIGDTDYILLEWPFLSEPIWGEDLVERILAAGLHPIFAHVERYEYFYLHPERLEEYIRKGVICQINAGALLHKETQRQALTLISRGDVHIICSDAHNMEHRKPRLAEAYEVIRNKLGVKAVRRLQENGCAVFDGLDISKKSGVPGGAHSRTSSAFDGMKKAGKIRIWQAALLTLVAIPVLGAAAFGGLYVSGENRQESYSGDTTLIADSVPAEKETVEEEKGVVTVDGKKYRYNDNLVTILCMGIDAADNPKLQPYDKWGASGQADTVMLAVYDKSTKEMKLIGISRDTIMQIRAYTIDGVPSGTVEDHLSLGWAAADGSTQSCLAMEENVSNLFYGIPIDAYCALNIDGIGELNDAIGGVTVVVPNDDLNTKPYYWQKGDTTLLQGKMVSAFVRSRDTKQDGSNNGRMERQKTYAAAFIKALKTQIKSNPAAISSLYTVAADYMLTDISLDYAVYLGTNMAQASFSADDIVTVAGENDYSDDYDAFYVDEAAMKQLVLDTFYEEVPETTASTAQHRRLRQHDAFPVWAQLHGKIFVMAENFAVLKSKGTECADSHR